MQSVDSYAINKLTKRNIAIGNAENKTFNCWFNLLDTYENLMSGKLCNTLDDACD